MSFGYLTIDPYLTTYHSNIDVHIIVFVLELGKSALTYVHLNISYVHFVNFFEECRRHVGFGNADVDAGRCLWASATGRLIEHTTHINKNTRCSPILPASSIALTYVIFSPLSRSISPHMNFQKLQFSNKSRRNPGFFGLGLTQVDEFREICEFLVLIWRQA